jgi:hypothetical protein
MAGAYHAAGHAVANIVEGLDLHPVTVPVDDQHNGVVVDHVRVAELRATHEMPIPSPCIGRHCWRKKCAPISRGESPSAASVRGRGAAVTIRATRSARWSCCYARLEIPN